MNCRGFGSNNHSLEIQLMNRFISEFQSSTFSQLPREYSSEFQEFFITRLRPDLKGSLQVTIHGVQMDRIDPRTGRDWTISSLGDKISLSKCFVRSNLCEATSEKCVFLTIQLFTME